MRLIRLLFVVILMLPGVSRAEERLTSGSQLGLSLGSPGGLNVEFLHEFGSRAVYLCGGYYGSASNGGIQAGLTLERGGTDRKYFAVNLIAGHLFFEEDTGPDSRWGYGGFEAYGRYRRAFLAPAITFGGGNIGNGDTNGPVILVRLGLTWPL